MKFRFGFLAAILLVLPLAAQGNAQKGKAAYQICATCHGQNAEGNKALNSPVLAGQEEWYLKTQLKNFKNGIRGKNPKDTFGMQMQPMSMTLATDQAVNDVVAYIKTLPPAGKIAATIKGDLAKGKAKYAVCATCHGPNAEGNKVLNAPKLTNQFDWYLVTQLSHFKSGVRGSDSKDTFGMQMKPMAATLVSDQDVKDVVAYIQSLAK